MFVVESTNIFPLRTRFDIFSCFGWDWKLCFDVCKMSVTSTAIAKLCYKTSSKKFAIQYFLWLIAGWILTGSYNFFKSFHTIFKSVCKGNINCFGKPFWERIFFLHDYLISDIGPCQELDIFNSLRQFSIFCMVSRFFFS